MTVLQQKIVSKILIHIMFWIFYFLILFIFDFTYAEVLGSSWVEKIKFDRLLLVFFVTYINDLVLLPYFLKRKSYGIYTLCILALTFLATFYNCYFILECVDSLLFCFSDDLWVIALPVVSLSLIWILFQFLDKQKELEKSHQDRLELELKFLKQQINPHVLFNSLNTIYAKAVNENEEIAEMILMLSENLKYVLNQSDSKLVSLEKDIHFIENYLEFQKLRTEGINRVTYRKKIDSYTHSIAPLLMIDLIENAFKYSPYKNDEPSEIDIYLEVNKGNLHFRCKNDYDAGFQPVKTNSTQIGLKNLKQRLNLLYKDKFELSSSQIEGKFILDLKIELL